MSVSIRCARARGSCSARSKTACATTSARYIAGDTQGLVHGDRIDARKSLTQQLAAQQFHDDEQRAHVLAVSEHTDDVRTVEVSDRR